MIGFCLRWLGSKKVRLAVQLRHQVWKYLNAQRDLLPRESIQEIQKAMEGLSATLRSRLDRRALDKAVKRLEEVANRRLKSYPHAVIRENVEVALVAGAVVLAFRSFFFQPMAIPSGSAQPTFWGITHEDLRGHPDEPIPGFLPRFYLHWVKGEKFYHVAAKHNGAFRVIDSKPVRVIPFVRKQRFLIGDERYAVWFPPDNLWGLARLRNGMYYHKGEDIIKLKVTTGDHLFVDRFTYNFRRPRRGETIVFKSTGVPGLTQHTHYIKRLVGLGGETIQIGNDRHVRINGKPLDASVPGFEFVYTFHGPPQVNKYSGHVNNAVGLQYAHIPLAPLFPNESSKFKVRPNHYFVLGDNTMNSHDSRAWGDFPREKVIGKQFFVFWPITERFGWHNK